MDNELVEIIMIISGTVALVLIMGIFLIAILMNTKEKKEDDDILDQPVHFPIWMDCPTCPNTSFILSEDDADCIVECSRCNVSYIVDIPNKQLVVR